MVDDERMIADLLYEYLQLKLEGELELYKSYSGRDAIEIMENIPIDILVTDITMPGINGLMLHKRAKELNPRCSVIFISGYNDFGNIQYALRNESVDFILKSESNDVIYNSICKAIATLDQFFIDEQMQVLTRQQWELSIPILQERLMLSVLDGEVFNPFAFTEIEFPLSVTDKLLLMMGRIDEGYSLTKTALYQLKGTVDEFIRQENQVFSVIHHDDILWLVQPCANNATLTKSNIMSAMGTIHDLCLKSFNISMSMVLSEDYIAFEEMSVTWIGLRQTIKNLRGLSSGMLLIEYDNNKPPGVKADWLHIRNILRQINLSIERLQQEKYEKYYAELMYTLRNAPQHSYSEKMEIVLRIYMAFLSHSNNNGINQEIQFEDYFADENHWELYDTLFAKIAEDFFTKQSQTSFKNTNQILGRLKHYIHDNLCGDTSLNKLAEIAHFSPTYLSRLFKQLTNVSLTEYIGRLKYEKAAQLLVDTNMKIIQISTELGFETQSYFSRFFKKYAGVGPQEYRDSMKG